MTKKWKIIIPIILIIFVVLGIFLINKSTKNDYTDNSVSQPNAELNSSQNKSKPIEEYSEEFVDNYIEGTKEIIKNDKLDNILIVGSDNKITDSYGASKIVEAPNNQYFLQYDNVEEKNNALEKLKKNNEINYVEKNITYKIESYNSWGIIKMGLDNATQSVSTLIGNNLPNVTVAIIDTGCNMTTFNNNYQGKITESYNALTNSTDISDMSDSHGHRYTHCRNNC